MLKFIKSKKGIALLATLVVVGASAFGALAYFTNGGSGSASGAVGHSSNIALHGSIATTLVPGTTSVVNFTADNPGAGNQLVGTIHAAAVHACLTAIASPTSTWDGAACTNGGTRVTTCESLQNDGLADSNTTNFYMSDTAENQDLAPTSTGTILTTNGSIKMNDLASSQDSCKDVTLTLDLTS